MSSRPYALWDTLADTRLSWQFLVGSTPAHVRAARCRRRVGPFEAAVSSGMVPERGPGSALDLQSRRHRYDAHLEDPSSPDSRTSNDGCVSGLDVLVWAPDDLVGILVLLVVGVLIGFVFLPLIWAPVWITRWRRRRRCRDAMSHGLCPDCRYDLSGCPSAIDPKDLHGQNIGPRMCPECGVPWPLLPPDVRMA